MALFVGDPSAPTRFGTDVADTSDETGLFLKIFGGEVFAAFSETTIMMDKHFVREISSGKSAQFPKTWKVSAAYHVAGQEMLGQDTDETERVISVDGLLVSHIGIYDLDEAMSHFDVRSRYTDELGRSIARVFDTNVMRTVVKTARADTSLSGASSTTPFPDGEQIDNTGGAIITAALAATGAGDHWWEAIRQMRVNAGGDNVPDSERLYMALPYDTYDSLKYAYLAGSAANGFVLTDRDHTFSDVGGTGVTESILLENVQVMRSNLIPQSNDTANTDIPAKYRANFSTTLGVGWGRDGVGTVKLVGMGLEQTRDTRRQEDFIVAKMAVGHGPLRNELTWEFIA